MSTTTQSFRRQDRSVRFSFRFAQEEITLFDRRELEMKPPSTQDLTPFAPEERSGFWVEVQDKRGRALYRRGMPHPMLGRSEGPAAAVTPGGETPRTHIWTLQRGAFSVVVPNLDQGQDLVLLGSPTDTAQIPQPAAEILRVALREGRTGPADRPDSHPAGDS